MSATIDLADLSKILELVIAAAVRKRGTSEVALAKDFYWHIPREQLYNLKSDVSEIDVGSLFDDWDVVKEIATGDQEPLAINLVALSHLVRYLGEELGDELAVKGG